MEKLVLFDIDRTLIVGDKSHRAAFSHAFKKVYGVETNIDVINPHGMTDQQVIIEVLKKNDLDEATIKSKLKECMEAMISHFNEVVDEFEITIIDGIPELLEELKKNNILLGLVTGNLEPIAHGKLKKVGLDQYFKVGGFGSDDINRTNLVKLAIGRAEQNLNFKFENNVFVVGDTPKDVKAGKEAGVKTIAVATGLYSTEQLKNTDADFVFDNFSKSEILQTILNF